MTAPLDGKAFKAAELAWTGDARIGLYPEQSAVLANAIRAYLAASPSPSMEMEDERVAALIHTQRAAARILRDRGYAMDGYHPSWPDHMEAVADALSQAQSALAAMRVERDEAARRGEDQWAGWVKEEVRRKEAEAQVLRLTEENEALRKERDEAVSIARNVTKALVDLTPSGSEYFTHSSLLDCYYADTEACTRAVRDRFDSGHKAKIERVDERRRAEAAEARIKALEEALRKIEGDLQGSIDTHEFNARHLIAEDSLQDAWKMLEMAREQFQVDANTLCVPLATARSALGGNAL